MARSISKNRLFRTLFTKLAPFYDTLEPALTWGQGRAWRDRAVAAAGPRNPHRVLEACAGTGLLTAQLAKAYGPHCHIVAIDFCPAMATLARQRLQALGLHRRAEVKVENVEIMPYPDEYVDAAFLAFGLRFVSDLKVALRELYRVLRPGGTLVLLELANPAGRLTRLRAAWQREVYIPRLLAWRHRLPSVLLHPLHDSLVHYPDPEQLARALMRTGFDDVTVQRLNGGVAALHTGRKLTTHPLRFDAGEDEDGSGRGEEENGSERTDEEN